MSGMKKTYKTFFFEDEDEDSELLIIPSSLAKSLGWSHLGSLEVSVETNQAKKLGIFISKPELRCPRCTHLLEEDKAMQPQGMRCSNPECEYVRRIYNTINHGNLTLDK
jgi:hypothetical protein